MVIELLKNKSRQIEGITLIIANLSLALVFLWYGFLKFSEYEAQTIEGLIASSPLISWMHAVFSVQGASNVIGTIELITGILIITGLRLPLAGVLGGLLAIGTFLMTVSFMLTVPVIQDGMGFPYLSAMPGQFLLKDVALLGLSVWVFGNAVNRL